MFPFSFIGSGVDAQALASYNSLIAAGYTVPQGLAGINSAFTTIKTIYGTSDITTAISYFADPSLAYQSGAGSGTTLGQAIRTLPNLVDNTRATDAVQTTAASQPLLLTHEGANYWQGVGVAGNFVSTPNAAANNIVNDFDIKITATYIFNSTINSYIGKWDSGQQSWRLYLGSDNRLVWNIQGQSLFPSSVAINSTMNHLRVTRQSSNGEIKYFFSTEPLSTSLESITWVQLGITQMGVTGSAPTTTSSLRIGQEQGNPFNGKIYRVTVANTIGGAPVVDFNPSQYNASVSQTEWTSSTGEIWSINTGTAATGYKGVLVDRTTMQGDAIGAYMQENGSLGINVNSANSFYLASRKFTTASQFPFEYRLASGSNGIICRISNVYSNYREGQSYFATTFSNNTLLNLFNSVFQANNNRSARLNSATIQADSTAGTISTQAINNIGIFGFGAGTGANYNGTINSLIITKVADNSTQQTEMYNYIRSINNNAF
jgi:hypothetical protein